MEPVIVLASIALAASAGLAIIGLYLVKRQRKVNAYKFGKPILYRRGRFYVVASGTWFYVWEDDDTGRKLHSYFGRLETAKTAVDRLYQLLEEAKPSVQIVGSMTAEEVRRALEEKGGS